MALVCPVGHPPGTGTTFCRLCGRDYVESVDPVEAQAPAAPAPAELAPAEPPVPASLGFGQPAPGPGQTAPRAPGMVPQGEVQAPVLQGPGHEVPAPSAPVPTGPPAHAAPEPALAQVLAMPPAAQPYQPHHGAPVPDLQVPPAPVEVEAGHGGVQLQAALQTVTVPQQGEAPAAEQTSELEDEAPSKTKAALDRTVLLAAAGAGFVGGVVATLATSSLLG